MGRYDGLVDIALEHLSSGDLLAVANDRLRQAAGDIQERRFMKKPRSVEIKVELHPEFDDEGNMHIEAEGQVSMKVPGTKTTTTVGFVTKEGRVLVSPAQPSDRQMDIEDETEKAANVTPLKGHQANGD